MRFICLHCHSLRTICRFWLKSQQIFLIFTPIFTLNCFPLLNRQVNRPVILIFGTFFDICVWILFFQLIKWSLWIDLREFIKYWNRLIVIVIFHLLIIHVICWIIQIVPVRKQNCTSGWILNLLCESALVNV